MAPNPIDVAKMPSVLEFFKMQLESDGKLSTDYHMFRHSLSILNTIAVSWQCDMRNIEKGPSDTYKGWAEKNRTVKKGEKALYVLHPRKYESVDEDTGRPKVWYTFYWKGTRFALSQTEGDPLPEPEFGDWDLGTALWNLEVEPIAFDMDGNTMGYAMGRSFAINPMGTHQNATTLHELAHIELGHTSEPLRDIENRTPRDLKEFMAEGTAMLCLEILGYKDHAESVGYMRAWYKNPVEEVKESHIRKMMSAADRIVKAGYHA